MLRTCLASRIALRTTNVNAYGFKKDVYFMCSALAWPRGLKNDECYMRMALRTTFVSCVALVLPRGFKNDECYMRMALRTTYISCVAHLFGLMGERYFFSRQLT